jgi:hypothetical protein
MAWGGASDVIVGTELTIANVDVPEVPPPGDGFVTVMFAVPVLLISLAGTEAVILVALE